MNIYMIREDGQDFCIRAEAMQDAIKVCEESYIDSLDFDFDANAVTASTLKAKEVFERRYYHTDILQSCSLIGELKN